MSILEISEILGNLGEFVGAIGVVVTLVYLAYQIRQNTRQLEQNVTIAKATAVNASTIAQSDIRRSVYETEEMSEIFRKGLEEPKDLSESELFRFRLVVQNVTDAIWAAKRIVGSFFGNWFLYYIR